MNLEVFCATCGKDKSITIHTDEPIPTISQVIANAGWIAQQNGPNYDLYCSKKCAL